MKKIKHQYIVSFKQQDIPFMYTEERIK